MPQIPHKHDHQREQEHKNAEPVHAVHKLDIYILSGRIRPEKRADIEVIENLFKKHGKVVFKGNGFLSLSESHTLKEMPTKIALLFYELYRTSTGLGYQTQ